MAKTPTKTVLASSQSLAAAGTLRVRLDVSGADGGHITWAITNGATGPNTQCVVRVLVSHATSFPATAAEGTGDDDWKQVQEIGGGVVSSAKTRGRYIFGRAERFIEIEFTGHTGQAVTVEAIATTFVS